MSQPVAVYANNRTIGRPDLDDWGRPRGQLPFGWALAKKHQKYVHGAVRQSFLMHKVKEVRLRWWGTSSDGSYLVRLVSPDRIIAETMCGQSFHLHDAGRAAVCPMPRPGATLCGRCHGTGVTFPAKEDNRDKKRKARVHLGCGSGEKVLRDVTDCMRA